MHYRARLLAAYVLPLVYADVINVSLTASQAKRVAQQIDIRSAYEEGLQIAEEATDFFDSSSVHRLTSTSLQHRDVASQLSGFLHEATAISLVNRPQSAKLFAVPTTVYDDELADNKGIKADGIVYDQRAKNTLRRRNPFQVKASPDGSYLIPVITAHDMANHTKASMWPRHDLKFSTLRQLIAEKNGEVLDQQSASTLDRLSGFVIRKALS